MFDHPFDRALALVARPNGHFIAHTSDDYPNHIGFYGGYVAALAINAALQRPDRLGDPVTLTVNYAQPLTAGEFLIEIDALCTTRSTQHWSIRLMQQAQVKVSALAVFGKRRDVWNHTELKPPQTVPAEQCEVVPSRFGGWFRNYELRVPGGSEVPGTDTLSTWNWIAEKPPRPLDFSALTAMCDAYYPRLYLKRPKRSGVATISLNVYFHVDAATLFSNGSRPVLATADGQIFAGGFHDQHGELWSETGRLLATTHQIIYYR